MPDAVLLVESRRRQHSQHEEGFLMRMAVETSDPDSILSQECTLHQPCASFALRLEKHLSQSSRLLEKVE